MSGITLKKTDPTDVPTPATNKATIFLDDGSGEPSYKDDAAVVHTLVGTTGADGADAPPVTYNDHGNTGSTEAIDFSLADIQRLVANAATVTLSYTNVPTAGTPGLVQAWLEQDGSGGRIWAFPAATDWGDAGEPDWSTRSGGAIDLVNLEVVDGGTTVAATLAGRAGAPGAAGADGDFGGAIAINYTFSTTTTDSDPGSGNLRLSNATQTSATVIRADLNDSHGVDWTAVLASLANSTNTVKGHIRLVKRSDLTKWLVYTVSAVASPSGYKNITVANVSSSGVNPLGNGDAIVLLFTRAGDVGASGTASVGSDPIWDAAGDLAVGSGADTAAKLTKGAAGANLSTYNGAVAWNGGTSFPASPATGDRYWRSDLGIEAYYDGTRWLGTTLRRFEFQQSAALSASGDLGGRISTWATENEIYLVSFYVTGNVNATNDGTRFWTFDLYRQNTGTVIATRNTSAWTASTQTHSSVAINALMGSTVGDSHIECFCTKTSTPGNMTATAAVTYRVVYT